MALLLALALIGDGVVFTTDFLIAAGVIHTTAVTGVAATGTVTGMAIMMVIMPEVIILIITVMIGTPIITGETDPPGVARQMATMRIIQEVQGPLVICMRINIRQAGLPVRTMGRMMGPEQQEAYNLLEEFLKVVLPERILKV